LLLAGYSTYEIASSPISKIMSSLEHNSSLRALLCLTSCSYGNDAKLELVSTTSKTMTVLSRLAIIIAVLSALALVGTLVLYFQNIAIPAVLMAFCVWGLPLAFALAIVVVIGNIAKRRNN